MMIIPGNGRYLVGRVSLNSTFSMTCNFSTNPEVPVNVPKPRVTSSQVAQFRKGAGGRASFSGNVVTVFGANGRLGQAVVNRLAKFGNQIIIPYRCDPYWVRELKISGDLGQILFFPFNLKDEDAIRKAVKYSNIVVNLIGTSVNTKNFSMYDTHEHGARRIARIAREMGVNRLIHVSAMGADPNYKSGILKKADFLRSKGLGEIAVRDVFPDATIVRPSIMFGESDKFIYHYLTYFRKNPIDWVKLYKCGEETYKMPIYIGDVSVGINKAVLDPTSAGKTYDFVGPHNYKMAELIEFMFKKARVIQRLGYAYHVHDHWDPYFSFLKNAFAVWSKIFRKDVKINMEWVEYLECATDFLSNNQTIGDLGVTHLSEFENIGARFCLQNSFVRSYEERYLEIDVEPPLPIRSPPIFKGQLIPPGNSTPFHRQFFLADMLYTTVMSQFRDYVDDSRKYPRTIHQKDRRTAHLHF